MDTKTHGKVGCPCGKCPECRKRRISGWSFRLLQESKRSTSAHFVTLTYNTETVPITPKGYMNLQKRDVQLFMKRLRKLSTNKLKYYLCGEYGGTSNRPHYHVILFNAQIADIEKTWCLGNTHYGEVEGASIGYTLKYMSKVSRIPMHQNDDRQPEFSLMSKGLGQNYLTEAMQAWHKADLLKRVHMVLPDGKKVAMPRYYKDKLYNEQERARIAFILGSEIRQADLKKEMENFKKYGDQVSRMKADHDRVSFSKMALDATKRNKI